MVKIEAVLFVEGIVVVSWFFDFVASVMHHALANPGPFPRRQQDPAIEDSSYLQ